jgi:hypothetical protein
MGEINDGGPAFAQVQMVPDPEFPGLRRAQLVGGMTRRQYLAAHAPITYDMVVNAGGGTWPSLLDNVSRGGFFAIWACLAYEWADAMLAEEAQRAKEAEHGAR